jgi:DNA adenine methylase
MAIPIIPWIGGKRRLAERLIPQFPRHTCYVEVFAGGAALYFMRPPADVEVINDINGDLVNLYRVVQRHLKEFVHQFEYALASREIYKWHRDANPEGLTDIERAARFFYLQQHAFGGKVHGQNWGTATTTPAPNILRMEEALSAAHQRLAGAYIENLDWKACIERYDRPHTFFYMDPPYWQTEGYGVDFELDQYQAMAKVLASLQGRAIVSLNDHPDIRRIFAGFHIEVAELEHNLAGGGKAVKRSELIIYSWDKAADPAGLF